MPRLKSIDAKKIPGDFHALVRLLLPCVIHDDVGYRNMQEMIDALTNLPRPTAGQREYLETLAILFSAYEQEHHAIPTGDLSPLDMLRHLTEAKGMTQSDLGRLLGERSLGSKILAGDREMSKSHIRLLSKHFGVSSDLFL